MSPRALQIDDLYRIPALSEPALSPDGAWVAYVVTTADRDSDGYRSQIWRVGTTGDATPQPWTDGPHDGAPRWSPDGATLAFVAAADNDVAQLFVKPADGGARRQVTSLAGGAGDPEWSPDGTRVAVVSRVRVDDGDQRDDNAPVVLDRLGYKYDGAGLIGDMRMHLFVVDVESGETVQVTSGDFSVANHRWSPDGSSIAYSAPATADSDVTGTSAVFVVASSGGEPRRITPAEATLAAPTWWPDGTELLVAGRERLEAGHTRLFVVPESGGTPKPVAVLDRNVMLGAPAYPGARPVVLDDGTILFAARDRGCTHVFGAAGDGPPDKRVGGDDRAVSGLSVSAGTMAYVVADPTSCGEIAVNDIAGSNERVLTSHCQNALPDVELPTPRACTFTAPDGTEVHGWVLRGNDSSEPTPLLLDIHGGPHNAWSPIFDGVHLYHHELVARGWTVLILNPRASDGYGEEFYRGTLGAWGLADEHDFLVAVDALVEEGSVDPTQVVVTGNSYGGFMTCWLSARHPTRWAAAIPGGVVSNLVSLAGTSDLGRLMARVELAGQPWAEADRYAEGSPISYVDGVTAPTLVIQGERDDRCPVGQAEEWFTALRLRKVPAELVRYPGGSHLFIVNGRPSHRADWCRRVVDWAARHTGG